MTKLIPEKPVILTGVKPTGKLHIGNYIGAISNWRQMIEENECLFFIADLHCLTITPDPVETLAITRDQILWYIACGLDPKKCHIFLQSHITGHTELGWVLGCLSSVGQLERMTQYKDLVIKGENAYGGMMFYPVLMAADILIYNADKVPVGEDQKQHVELTRDLAEKFNRVYCSKEAPLFSVPEPIIPKAGARIMSLKDPMRKMSKSDEENGGCILLEDTPDKIRKKIMGAVTDSGSEIKYSEDKPGVSNLLEIMSVLGGKPILQLEAEMVGKRYGDLKKAVADTVVEALAPIQAKHKELASNPAYIAQILADGAAYAQPRARATMKKVYELVGLMGR